MRLIHIRIPLVFIGFSIVSSVFSVSDSLAAPGHRIVEGKQVTPSEARQFLSQHTRGQQPMEMLGSMALETAPEIAELARGLRNDPNLIYKFVRDHIEYTPIYGCIKGPRMTLLDGCGNDFDQVSLFIALLRQAGYTANYVYGVIYLTPEQITSWLRISADLSVICNILPSAGIPFDYSVYPDGSIEYVYLVHVWAKVNISGTNYVFDPSFKSYSSTAGIDLKSAMGYDSNTFLARASAGATIQQNYVKNINKSNLTADLSLYSTNLINHIRANLPSATLKEIIGGRTIIPATGVPRQTFLPYQLPYPYPLEWTEIPVEYKVRIEIQHQGIDGWISSDQIYGKRLTLSYNAFKQPVLALDGRVLATGFSTTPGTSQPIALIVDHPYAAYEGTYMDDYYTFYITAGGTYLIVNGWASTGTKIIESHREILKQNRYANGSETSEPVLGESLAMVGFTWLAECSRSSEICDQIANTVTINHHALGMCGQYDAPYIDMPMWQDSVLSRVGDQVKKNASFFVISGHGSAFEWGVIEQIQPQHSAVSTVKLIDIANSRSYNKIFDATSSNYSTIKPQLVNYDYRELSDVNEFIYGKGYRVILPQDGDLGEGEWSGIGFIAVSPDEHLIAHIISGGLNGGFGTERWPLSDISTVSTSSSESHCLTTEPIDLVTGDYLHENIDLDIGWGSYPFSLEFKRFYNSSARLDDGPLGFGWKHNLSISAVPSSDGFQGLGSDSPIDAAASIVESYVGIDLLSSNKTNLRLTVATMAQRWFMDQLINNAVTIEQPGNSMKFVKLLDGNYNPPPGEAAKLTTQPDGSYLLKTKHGENLDFDPNGRITAWSDPNNTVSFLYAANGKLLQVSNEFGRSLSFTYDVNDANHIGYVKDSAGRTVSFGYNAAGNLTAATDANGFVTTFVCDPGNDGRITRIYYPTEPNNPFVTNVYDSLGRVKTQANANGFTYQYFYAGYRTEEIDPCNYSKVYVFNDYGRTLSETDPLDNQTDYEYDGQLRKTLVTYPRGNAVRYTYDASHNVQQVTQLPIPASGEPNIVEAFSYEPNFNRVVTYTDPNGRVTRFDYYANGKLREIDQPATDGNVPKTRFTYNAHGQAETITNPEGMVTKYWYDLNGNLITTIVDYGNGPNNLNITTTMTYNSVGDVNSTTDPRSNTTRLEYDTMRRLIKVISPQPFNYETLYEYYPDGSLKQLARQTSSPSQWQVTDYTYTPSGKVETVVDPNGDITQYQYDALDLLWKTTDAENHATTRLYDAAGRLWKIIDASGNTPVTYSYNANGSIKTLTDAKGNTTTYQYDGHNRLKKTIYPNSTFEQLSYDSAGNMFQKQTRSGQTIGYSYDPLNRLKLKMLSGPQQIRYAYDLAGRIKSVTDVSGTIRHSYDRADRLVGVTYPDGKSVSYQYDSSGNRLRLTYPDGTYATYDYDQLNRLTYIHDEDGLIVAHYDYDALSRRIGAQFANGTSATYIYSIADRLFTLNNQMTGASRSFAYGYDSVGNRLTMTTDVTALHRYNYDKIYQVVGADYPVGFFAADTTFNYDPAGNRKSVIGGTTTNYVDNNLNQYTSVGGIVYSYDNNGNLTGDGTNTYTYDADNRLTTTTTPTNVIEYTYDAFGRRTSKKTYDAIHQLRATCCYVYDGDQIICEYDGSGRLIQKILYGAGIDEAVRMTNVLPSANLIQSGFVDFADVSVLAGVWLLDINDPCFNPNTDQNRDDRIDFVDFAFLAGKWFTDGVDFADVAVLAGVWLLDINDPCFNPNADLNNDDRIDSVDFAFLAGKWFTDGQRSEDYYYHYDGLGSVIAISNNTGSVVETYSYDVFGTPSGTSFVGNRNMFIGREYDKETELYYYKARYYDPKTGRFLQSDPIGYLGGMNLYTYVDNNPPNWTDPWGLCKGQNNKPRTEEEVIEATIKTYREVILVKLRVQATTGQSWEELGLETGGHALYGVTKDRAQLPEASLINKWEKSAGSWLAFQRWYYVPRLYQVAKDKVAIHKIQGEMEAERAEKFIGWLERRLKRRK